MVFINDKGEEVVIDINPVVKEFVDRWDETTWYSAHQRFKYVICLGILGLFKDDLYDSHWILPVWKVKKSKPFIYRRNKL